MKLLMVGASPYARKVLVAAAEHGLGGEIECVFADPHVEPADLLGATPLSKVPVLIDRQGQAIPDSFFICLYLDSIGGGPPLLPEAGADGRLLARYAVANGMSDAAVLRWVEMHRSECPDRSAVVEKQRRVITRSLDFFERAAGELERDRVTIDKLALACSLAYLDYRFSSEDWRPGRPGLGHWFERISGRPSMQATTFEALSRAVGASTVGAVH